MAELISLEETEGILEDTGGVPVSYGGVTTSGHFDLVTAEFGTELGARVGVPFVKIHRESLPDVGLEEGTGRAQGIGSPITVGDYLWTVRDVEADPADPTLVIVYLTNRRTSGG